MLVLAFLISTVLAVLKLAGVLALSWLLVSLPFLVAVGWVLFWVVVCGLIAFVSVTWLNAR